MKLEQFTTEELVIMNSAVINTIHRHVACENNNLGYYNYLAIAGRCPLCAFATHFDGFPNCRVCPWVIFTDHVCEAYQYADNIASVLRLNRWSDLILQKILQRKCNDIIAVGGLHEDN